MLWLSIYSTGIVQIEWVLYMESEDEFTLSKDRIQGNYVWINYFTQIVDSTVHETFV